MTEKKFAKQEDVWRSVIQQRVEGTKSLIGMMVESHLNAGRQDLVPGERLQYGVSITDACLGWKETEAALDEVAAVLEASERRRRVATG